MSSTNKNYKRLLKKYASCYKFKLFIGILTGLLAGSLLFGIFLQLEQIFASFSKGIIQQANKQEFLLKNQNIKKQLLVQVIEPQEANFYFGEKLTKLSRRQRQQVALTHALLKNSLIILEKATSSLNSITKKKVKEVLDTLIKEKTIIAIAHHLSTIQNADIIVVTDNAKLVDWDSHKELVNRNNLYKNIWKIQQKGNG